MSTATAPASKSTQLGKPSNPAAAWIVILVVVSLLFLGGAILWTMLWQDVDSTYGIRAGQFGGNSVNGTGVLGNMFEQAGHKVRSRSYLSPKVGEYAEVIVWCPDDFTVPSDEVIEWFDNWLFDEPDRLLIYVGRDYDAAPNYWRDIAPTVPAAKQAEVRRRGALARTEFSTRRAAMPASQRCDWFRVQDDGKVHQVRTLASPEGWAEGVDASQLEIEVRSYPRMSRRRSHVLLESEGIPLVSSRRAYDGEIIVVANGSFLLNLPLVNHEHRKLAGRLVAEAPEPKRVVFLETSYGGPRIFEEEPEARGTTGLEILGVAPFRWIFLHLAAAGLVLSFYLFPIFGPPRKPVESDPSDFGKHIGALGGLLAETGEVDFARQRLEHYRQVTRQETPPRHQPPQHTAAVEGQPTSADVEPTDANETSDHTTPTSKDE